MRFLSFVYHFITDFAFLASVYFSLNYIDKTTTAQSSRLSY